MEEKRLLYLYERFVEHTSSAQELAEFDEFLSGSGANEMLTAMLDTEYAKQAEPAPDITEENRQKVLAQLTGRFGASAEKPRRVRLWPRIAVASAVAVMILGGGLFFYKNARETKTGAIAYQNDIAPGKQGATLTLANGRKIRLADAAKGELAKEAGISIRKTADGQIVYEVKQSGEDPARMNTLSTAKGETYVLTLPDGSRVWLNSASSLTYSAGLTSGGRRRVSLTGEAYFQVSKDKDHPFVVSTDEQQVEVLGTHFNINSYHNEPGTVTTLLEGSVRVKGLSGEAAVVRVLRPGEQSVLSLNEISVSDADTESATAWKNGDFLFNAQDIRSVMRKLERWYNIEVVYQGPLPEDKFQGVISRFRNISQVLSLLEQTKGVHFKVEGRRVTVSR